MSDYPPKIRCREIGVTDLPAIADLLSAGFPKHSRRFWMAVLELLSRRELREGYPRYGLMLEAESVAVGVILLIFAQMPHSAAVRCCGSGWYVMPAFRCYAPFLISRTFRYRAAVHLNLSPSVHTLPIIEALGYRRFCNGVFVAVPAFSAGSDGTKIKRVVDAMHPESLVSAAYLQLLLDHERFGCVSLWCETQAGGYPFIFRRRFVKRVVPAAQLIYCTSVDDFVRFAGPIGRFLTLRGMPFVMVPANGPIPKLIGKYFDGKPMYYRGPDRPQDGDLAYTETAMYGV